MGEIFPSAEVTKVIQYVHYYLRKSPNQASVIYILHYHAEVLNLKEKLTCSSFHKHVTFSITGDSSLCIFQILSKLPEIR